MQVRKSRSIWTIAATSAAGLIFGMGLPAGAATYVDSITVDASAFSCAYFVNSELCHVFTPFSGGPVTLVSGDTVTANVSFSGPVSVPGSASASYLYTALPDANQIPGTPALPGPNSATVSSTLNNYVGPPNPILGPYTLSYLNDYVAVAGFQGANPGFSATGINTSFLINAGDPSPISGLTVGYAWGLPSTPQVISSISGGTLGHPTILPAGQIGSITSDISGGSSPESQFYKFAWNGGIFQTNATIVDANPLSDFQFELLNPNSDAIIDELTLDSGNDFAGLISLSDLAAGNYEIGLTTDSPYDPQFTINFDTPVAGIPEPATWAMMFAGVFGVGGMMRSRRGNRSVQAT